MATIVLSAAGMALGGSIGGSVLGLSSAVIGRAAGALIGRAIDQRLMGAGSAPVETGRVERFRLTGASEGAPVGQVYGAARVAGQVIWASRFSEAKTTTSSKWSLQPATVNYSYSVSLAIALCEGEVSGIGRIWADGAEISRGDLALTLHRGTADQLPDPAIEAIEGFGEAPAYRGVAYVVIDNLDLGRFGNRVPQFNFEVFRPAPADLGANNSDLAHLVRGVALVPGTGEYALATSPLYRDDGFGRKIPLNLHTNAAASDLEASLDALGAQVPGCGSVSLVVSWFGDDLRCGDCRVEPLVEHHGADPAAMPWRSGGIGRAAAGLVPMDEGRPVYGGTPADQSVVEGIKAIATHGQEVMFYPFLMMTQQEGNSLPDPWTGAGSQPALPWRGRITTSAAPGQAGSPDETTAAEAEVAAFFGSAAPTDFSVSGTTISYSGPAEWSYRRFILHYAHLCAAAGGVGAFCIGSELRSLTQIRGAGGSFPAVAALRALAADVRAVLGPEAKIGYAADWSEYHGYQPVGTGDKLFHLDPLWADPNIDFIGIDHYMPLADWREGEVHADAEWGSVYDIGYLQSNIEGGEGYDWYYAGPAARKAQLRTPISDYWGEDWVWRYKDIRGWWTNPHHERIGGARSETPTAWVPQSKPIWLTELGCAAVDKGANEPNKFVDAKSSESGLPYASNGLRDDLIQHSYLRALLGYYLEPANNPISAMTGAPMVDVNRSHVWAWDARPYPEFPANTATWSDGGNYARGHWISGRAAGRSLAGVVAEICRGAGIENADTSRIHGLVRGYTANGGETARARLQPLMLAYGFDGFERDGKLKFLNRALATTTDVEEGQAVFTNTDTPAIEHSREGEAQISGRVRLVHISADGEYAAKSVEVVEPDEAGGSVSVSELPLLLNGGEAVAIAERWLAEARIARDTVSLSLPPSTAKLGVGDILRLGDGAGPRYRIDRLTITSQRTIEAVRVEPAVYRAPQREVGPPRRIGFSLAVPVVGLLMDLPLIAGDEAPVGPWFAASADPWPTKAALYSSQTDQSYSLDLVQSAPATVGLTETVLPAATSGCIDRGPALQVRLVSGALSSATREALLAGANRALIGDGSGENWEVFQFEEAELVGPDTWHLSRRLRGQSGTDGIMPDAWPVGSVFVLFNEIPRQLFLPASLRDVSRHYRYGPAGKALDHPSYTHVERTIRGAGLRPYRPCHVRALISGGDMDLSWIRRTRVDGDSWSAFEVPLGEESELYLVRILEGGVVLREATTSAPSFRYSAANQVADGWAGGGLAEISQISASYGVGPAARISLG